MTVAGCLRNFGGRLLRRKYVDAASLEDSQLARCLNTLDLTLLGVGSTLGAGVYVLTGTVARETAGPSIVLSFLVAAIASILAGLCYAEFGARVPKSGSAYVYSYVTVGELWAFIIGWNMILEYVIGTASVARAWSANFDSLVGNRIENWTRTHMAMHVSGLAEYPDFFSLGLTLVLTALLALGVKESTRFNNVFTGLNLCVILFVMVAGFIKADGSNWAITHNQIMNETTNSTLDGVGGFFPFGASGMLSGAATCFYAFVGFDAIATTGEEVKNPQRAIPISIVVSLTICFVAYFGVSAALTLMVPYYTVDKNAPLPAAFAAVGFTAAKYIIAVGAVCALSTSLLGAMFPMPRVIYAMASDGVIFRFLSKVNERTQTPIIATVLSGLLSGTMALLFDLKELVDMMSIGTLQAYTLVAACVLILRYQPVEKRDVESDEEEEEEEREGTSDSRLIIQRSRSTSSCVGRGEATERTGRIVSYAVLLLGVVIVCMTALLVYAEKPLFTQVTWWSVLLVCFCAAVILGIINIIWIQPQSTMGLKFKVPALPLLPILSMFVNIYLMMKLSAPTWIRFAVWMAVGFVIYFGYGMWHSSEHLRKQESLSLARQQANHTRQREHRSSSSETKKLATSNGVYGAVQTLGD
ncbi:high affinity cationic amino acid transporter 1-like isoform X2 [Branchiostoma floridae x Branchiostoma japonicum]